MRTRTDAKVRAEVVLWDDHLVGVTNDTESARTELQRQIERKLKNFYSAYLEAQ